MPNFYKGKSGNCRKRRKLKKVLYVSIRCCHGNDLHKVNNKNVINLVTKLITRILLIYSENVTNLAAKFREHTL